MNAYRYYNDLHTCILCNCLNECAHQKIKYKEQRWYEKMLGQKTYGYEMAMNVFMIHKEKYSWSQIKELMSVVSFLISDTDN